MSGYKPSYSPEEDIRIIRYIIDEKLYYKVRGTLIWKQMENKINKSRTWQSLKNRYLRTILRNLRRYNITAEERKRLEISTAQLNTMQDGSNKKQNVKSDRKEDTLVDLTMDTSDSESD